MKSIFTNIIFIIIAIIIIAALLGFVGFVIYVHVKFANVPIGQIPGWAAWIMFR